MANENLVFPLTEDGIRMSHEYGLQPLSNGQIVRYKLIESDQDDPSRTDLNGNHLKKTPGYVMTGKKIIFDQKAGRSVTIMTLPKKSKVRTALGDIQTTINSSVKFLSDKPIIEVHWNQPELYAFMELCDENIDNPRRNPRKPAKYYRVDPRKKLAKEVAKDTFELEALNWVAKEAKFNDLKACAEYVNSQRSDLKLKTDWPNEDATTGYELLKRELYALAKKDPQMVLKGSNKIESQAKMQLMDAEGLGLIFFVDSKTNKAAPQHMLNSWFHNEEKMPEKICTVDVGKNKHDALMEFLQSDKNGKEHYERIIMKLKIFLKPQ